MRHQDISNIPKLSKNAKKKIESILLEVNLLLIVEQPNETCQRVIAIVDCLPDYEKRIIQEKYLNVEAEYTTHKAVYKAMGISAPLYDKYREAAFLKIALGIEITDNSKIYQD